MLSADGTAGSAVAEEEAEKVEAEAVDELVVESADVAAVVGAVIASAAVAVAVVVAAAAAAAVAVAVSVSAARAAEESRRRERRRANPARQESGDRLRVRQLQEGAMLFGSSVPLRWARGSRVQHAGMVGAAREEAAKLRQGQLQSLRAREVDALV